jgi:hypothetical protein
MNLIHLDKLKGKAVILIVVLIVCLLGIPVSAATTTVISVSSPVKPVNPGQQFVISIIVQPGTPIAGAQLNLSFNPSLASVTSVVEGNLLKQNGANTYFMPGKINNIAGTITGIANTITTPGEKVSTQGILATVYLTAGASGGDCPINISNVIIGDANGQSVPINTINGQFTIDQPPILSPIGNKIVNEAERLTFTVSGTDPKGGTLSYSSSNLPQGATFNVSNHVFSWTPSYTQARSYNNIHFEVTNGRMTASEDITITVININRPPKFNSIGSKTVNEGMPLTFTVSATDPDGDSIHYSASTLPTGATFNNSEGTFYWIPTTGQTGTYANVHFEVTDGNLIASENIVITVRTVSMPWDANLDGVTNILDIILIGQHWNETGAAGWIREDVNSDGTVNVLDCIIVGQNWTA